MRGISVSQSNVEALCAICTAGSTGAVTITNSGTIETIGDDRPAIYTNDETSFNYNQLRNNFWTWHC